MSKCYICKHLISMIPTPFLGLTFGEGLRKPSYEKDPLHSSSEVWFAQNTGFPGLTGKARLTSPEVAHNTCYQQQHFLQCWDSNIRVETVPVLAYYKHRNRSPHGGKCGNSMYLIILSHHFSSEFSIKHLSAPSLLS